MKRIGTSPPRPDGLPKACGTLRYGDDIDVAELWFGATLRSPAPHARIKRISWKNGEPPLDAVLVTAADLPGPNGVRLIDDEWPILADQSVQHVGEAVALVAAPTRRQARQALDALELELEDLPAVFDIESGDLDNPMASLELGRGDVDAVLANARYRLQGTYRTGHQEHIYIECQAMTAWFDGDDGVEVVGSMQCPYYVHKSLRHAFGLSEEHVRVRSSAIGGGFGGKEDYPSMIAIHAALLARACGQPVRIAYDRHEDIVATTKRHPAIVTHDTAYAEDGSLEAMDIDVTMDGGAYPTLSTVVLSRALLHAAGPYRCPNVRIRGRVVRTNTATNGAFRGFGAPQTQFAIERHIDRVGRSLGFDPFDIRLRNALRPGDLLPTGQKLESGVSALACLERIEAETDFRKKWRRLEQARETGIDAGASEGIGLSLFFHGAGFTGNGENRMRSPVTVRLAEEGRLEVLTAMTDMGQGCAAIFPQIACDAGGLRESDVSFPEPDTARVPDSGPTVASRTTMVVGGTIALAVEDLVSQLLEWWQRDRSISGKLICSEGVVRGDDGATWTFRDLAQAHLADQGALEITRRHRPPSWQTFDEDSYQGAAYPTYAWGANVVEVEVDPDSLEVRPTEVTAVCEIGKAIHPVLCRGQVEGGTLQALAWGIMEELKVDQGRYLNDRLATYIIPTIKDSPRFRVHLLEDPWEGGPFGAKGVGELPMDGGAPAVTSAIENATGIRVDAIPAVPERLLEWERASQTLAADAAEGERR